MTAAATEVVAGWVAEHQRASLSTMKTWTRNSMMLRRLCQRLVLKREEGQQEQQK